MARTMNVTQVKATLLALLDDVADGDEIEITRHGRIVARLVPSRGPSALRGSLRGIATSVEDDEALFSTGIPWDVQG